jgi:hypothetical protein
MRIVRPKGRLAWLATALCAAILVWPTAATADVGETIIQRCTHGKSLAGFRPSDYSRALKELGADAEEYTSCAAQIRAAQLAAASGNPAAAGPAQLTPLPISPAEQRSLAHAAKAGGVSPVAVGGRLIRPGVVHVSIASALSSLPDPLLATVAFVLACLLAVFAGAVRNRVRARRPG